MLSFVLEDIRVATKMKIELGILSIEVLWDIFCGSQLFLFSGYFELYPQKYLPKILY